MFVNCTISDINNGFLIDQNNTTGDFENVDENSEITKFADETKDYIESVTEFMSFLSEFYQVLFFRIMY